MNDTLSGITTNDTAFNDIPKVGLVGYYDEAIVKAFFKDIADQLHIPALEWVYVEADILCSRCLEEIASNLGGLNMVFIGNKVKFVGGKRNEIMCNIITEKYTMFFLVE